MYAEMRSAIRVLATRSHTQPSMSVSAAVSKHLVERTRRALEPGELDVPNRLGRLVQWQTRRRLGCDELAGKHLPHVGERPPEMVRVLPVTQGGRWLRREVRWSHRSQDVLAGGVVGLALLHADVSYLTYAMGIWGDASGTGSE
jgi:hypothetical protein